MSAKSFRCTGKHAKAIAAAVPPGPRSPRATRGASGLGDVESRYRAAADLLDGYVHESEFLNDDSSPDHRIVWASEGFATIYGCTVDEYNRGEMWGGRYHPADRAAALERAAALRRGETVEAELRIMRDNGEVRWLYVKNSPIIDAATRQVTGVLGIGQDITLRKLAVERQKRTALILGSVIRSDPDWLLLLDHRLEVQFSNRALRSAHSQVGIGRPLSTIFRAADRGALDMRLCGVLERGARLVMDAKIDWPDGDTGDVEIGAAAVREEAGITGLAVRIADVSARKRDEETLRTQSNILKTIQEGVILFDGQGIVRYSNAAAERMFRMEPNRLPGFAVAQLGLSYDFGATPGRRERDAAQGSGPEALCCRADGTQFLAKLAYAELPLRDQVMAIAVLRDATEQKQLEREIIDIANREQQRIAVDLHDGLGQELTGVALMLRSLAERSSREYPSIVGSVEEVIALVNRAISETRTLARGLSPVELERGGLPVALNALASRTRESSKVEVTFRSSLSRGAVIPAAVADHFYRIAQEAASNAVRHSGATSIRISLVGRPGELRLSVKDNGCGIPQELSPAAGMGLRIMDYRARMMGAEVSVQSPDRGGTIVSCRLAKTGA